MCGLLSSAFELVLGGFGQLVHVELADGVLSEGVDDWESASALSVLNWSASYVKQPDGIQ